MFALWVANDPGFLLAENFDAGQSRESIKSSTTLVPEYQMRKKQNHNKHHKKVPRGQPFPFM